MNIFQSNSSQDIDSLKFSLESAVPDISTTPKKSKRKSLQGVPNEHRVINPLGRKELFIDPEENFFQKFEKYQELYKGSKNAVIFLDTDELLRRNISKYFEIEKNKYPDMFETYIKANFKLVKSSKGNNQISIDFSSGFREKIEDLKVNSKEKKVYQQKPTFVHKAIALLLNKGIFSHVITTETTNQLRIAGVKDDQLTEINGNTFCESNFIIFKFLVCNVCDSTFYRDYDVSLYPEEVKCEKCKGNLIVFHIKNGDSIPSNHMKKVREVCSKADFNLMINSPYNEL